MPRTFDYRPPTEPWLTVLHADDDIVVLDKPSGLLTVPGKDPALKDSLETRVREKWPTATVVHRLDKDTSGILLMALNKRALGLLGSQFEHRRTTKSYIARRWGRLEPGMASSTCRSPPTGSTSPASASTTSAAVRAAPNGRCSPTSRGHACGSAIPAARTSCASNAGARPSRLGDVFYATGAALAAADRLQLHAEELGFTHPDGTPMRFVSPAPF